MMYLSALLIDVGVNPDRPRPGRHWLRNLYRVHQRLCMAFPSAARKEDDPGFLAPFDPEDFGNSEPAQVHVPRGQEGGFLFRVDPGGGGRVVILVQSVVEPDWEYAFHNAKHFLAAPWQVKPFDPCFTSGEQFRFRLAANPTRRLSKHSPDAREESIGKRVPVPSDRLIDWLDRRAQVAGFSLDKDATVVQAGYVYFNKRGKGQGQRLRSARYDGTLTVTDPDSLRQALISGIGPAKAFGFGLLSLARVSP